jgi:transcriptional regulator with XRE-family HTH domain
MKSLEYRLKKLRNEKGVTQQELGDYLGVSRSTVAGYETGKRKPEYDTLHKLANYFNVSIDYLLGNTDERSPADKIKKAISDDPELLEFWEELKDREDLQLMFKQTRDLSPETIQQIISIIKTFEKEQDDANGG